MLARRIDRLSRRAHRFHQFAHHPLCTAYAGELIALGRRTRLCRGCAMTGAGVAAGLASGVAGASLGTWRTRAMLLLASWLFLGISGGVAWLGGRPSKLLTRALPALAAGATLGCALRSNTIECLLLVAGIGTAGALFGAIYRRRGPDRTPCTTCPERNATGGCSGFRPMVRRERAFRRLSARWLTRAGT
jgi:hypothetical protein